MHAIRTGPELYAHAIAIEREAAARYAQFAERLSDLGSEAVAEMFSRLAAIEGEHLETLLRRTEGIALPAIADDEYHWIEAGPANEAARELALRLMTSRQALAIALAAEMRAQAFFERVFMTAEDPALRSLAQEMAAEEMEHVVAIEGLLARTRAIEV